MAMKNLPFIIALLLFCIRLSAQTTSTTGSLKGTVTSESAEPIFSATVVLTQNNVRKQVKQTDFDGKFSFDSLAAGKYDLTVKYVGYPDQLIKEISITAAKTETVNVQMALSDSNAKEVVIVQFRNPEFNRDETTQMEVVRPKELKNLATRNVNSAVATSSGVVRTDKSISGKGGRYSSNIYYVDGIKMTGSPNLPSSQIYETKADATNVQIYNSPEAYKHIAENGWVKPSYEPLSTFSIDVDAASYSNMRRFLKNGQLPPPDAVRIEEMVNYFNYNYPQPTGEHPFHVFSEMANCPWNPEHKLVHIGIQGKIVQKENLPASNLVFLIDVSGSMSSPDKLPLVKQSLDLLTNELRKEDKVAIVVYAGAAGVVLPSTTGSDKNRINAALRQLEAGGSTAGGAGIELAYKLAKENFITGGNNRVILATDGDFNVGQSSEGELVRLIEEKRKDGIFLTVLGYGTGNYQDSKMQELADKGNGNHAYIDDIMEAKKVLVNEFGGTLFTIAKDVKLQVEWNPTLVKGYRLIGYENRMLNKEDFNDDKKDAGELGSGHTVTALYEIVPASAKEEIDYKVDSLKYQANIKPDSASHSNEIFTLKLRYKLPDADKSKLLSYVLTDDNTAFASASENLRWSSTVAAFGLLLRDSQYKGNASYSNIIAWAKAAKGKDDNGYRSEFIQLAEVAALYARKESKK